MIFLFYFKLQLPPEEECHGVLSTKDGHGKRGYVILEDLIKKGSTSHVYRGYRAEDKGHHEMAFKLVHPEFTSVLLREYQMIRRLKHENILQVYKIQFTTNTDHPQAVMHMQCAELGNLKDYLAAFEFPPSTELRERWKRDLVSAVEYIHRRGITHGNITPKHILIDRRFKLILADFAHSGFKLNTIETCSEEDESNFPPEIVLRDALTVPACYDFRMHDAWCVGIVLFTILNKTPPFNKDAPLNACIIHHNKPVLTLLSQEKAAVAGKAYTRMLSRLLDFGFRRRASMRAVVEMNYYENFEEILAEVENNDE